MKTGDDIGAIREKVPVVGGMMPTESGTEGPVAGPQEPAARSQWQLVLRRFLRHRLAVFSLLVLLTFYLVIIFAGTVAPAKPNPVPLPLLKALRGPSLRHLTGPNILGTDSLGRDEVTRLIYGGRISLTVGLFVAVCSTLLGTAIGATAGYFGGAVDQLLMRFTDLFLVVPAIAIIAMAEKGLDGKNLPLVGVVNSTTLIIGILSFVFWQSIARVVRGLFLSIKEKEFVEAAKASGASSARIMVRHILPNVIGPILVNTTLVVGYAIVTESTLSFLGFGIRLPTPSWGNMLNESEQYVGSSHAYLVYLPGIALLFTVLAVNFLGDGLRDAFDPQASRH